MPRPDQTESPSQPPGQRPPVLVWTSHLLGPVRRRFSIVFLLLAAVCTAPWIVAVRAHEQLNGLTEQVDLAGSVRFRMLDLGMRSTTATGADDRAEIERLVAEQQRTLTILIEGSAAADIPACPTALSCARLREHLAYAERELLPHITALQEGPAPHAEAVRDTLLEEVTRLDATVHLLAHEARDQVDAVRANGRAATILGWLLLAVAGVGIWETLGRLRRLEQATRSATPERAIRAEAVGSDEVASLARALGQAMRDLRIAGEGERQRVEQLLEAAPDAVLVVDAEGAIRYANEQAEELFGWTRAALLELNVDVLVPEQVRPRHRKLRESYTGSPSIRSVAPVGDLSGLRRDGTEFPAEIKLSPVVVGGATHVTAIVRDITQRREDERRLRAYAEELEHMSKSFERSNRELQARNEELEQFAFVASHDLQEPLRKIIVFGDRLDTKYREVLDGPGRDYLARMIAASRRMQELITDLLAWSRLTTRAKPFQPVDLDLVMKDVLTDLELTIEQEDAKIVVGELGELDADPVQMRQLMQNLLGNALKYRRAEVAPEIHVERTDADDGELLRLHVRDNGIGFEAKHAERIFTLFERLHGRGAYEGTGIGLAICKKIAIRHGGMISAHAIPNDGSEFIVTLPRRQLARYLKTEPDGEQLPTGEEPGK